MGVLADLDLSQGFPGYFSTGGDKRTTSRDWRGALRSDCLRKCIPLVDSQEAYVNNRPWPENTNPIAREPKMNRMRIPATALALGVVLMGFPVLGRAAVPAGKRPNIVLILTDDKY